MKAARLTKAQVASRVNAYGRGTVKARSANGRQAARATVEKRRVEARQRFEAVRDPGGQVVTYTRFLVLEWLGRWAVPDHEHGGIHPGPYVLRSEAERAIETYADSERDYNLAEPYSSTVEAASSAYADLIRRHTIVQISVPEDPTLEPCGMCGVRARRSPGDDGLERCESCGCH